MKTAYFDTCVYNALVDSEHLMAYISDLKNTDKIEIIFSEYVFNELVCTWMGENDYSRGRTAKLFKCVSLLISDRILYQQEVIINAEIKSFINKSNNGSIFCSQERVENIKETINRLACGEKITNVTCLKDIVKTKKAYHGKIKAIKAKHNLHILEDVPYANFNDWYRSQAVNKYEDELIKNLITQKIDQEVDFDIIRNIQNNKTNLVHLNALLRMAAAYQFALLAYKKPKLGDGYDQKHFVCSATINDLVCDGDFLPMLKWVYPEKNCYTIDRMALYFQP